MQRTVQLGARFELFMSAVPLGVRTSTSCTSECGPTRPSAFLMTSFFYWDFLDVVACGLRAWLGKLGPEYCTNLYVDLVKGRGRKAADPYCSDQKGLAGGDRARVVMDRGRQVKRRKPTARAIERPVFDGEITRRSTKHRRQFHFWHTINIAIGRDWLAGGCTDAKTEPGTGRRPKLGFRLNAWNYN